MRIKSSRIEKYSNPPLFTGTDKPMNFATDQYSEYKIAQFCDYRFDKGFHTITRSSDINVDANVLSKWLSSQFILIEPEKNQLIGMMSDMTLMFVVQNKQWATRVIFTGEPLAVEAKIQELESMFHSNPCYVRWVYDPQYMEHLKMPVNTENLPFQEMYPYLEEDLFDYYDRFISSSANVLLLIGPPGTGKTSFLRGLMHHSKQSATLTYHEKILEQDSFFVNWLETKDMFMIIEDADNLLLPRKDGNNLMARFLNMGDGLMGFTNKKIVFSTNLPNVSDVDPALTRPGRCFDILKFRNLNRQESQLLADKIGTDLPYGDSLSVSEIFAEKRNENINKKSSSGFGFI